MGAVNSNDKLHSANKTIPQQYVVEQEYIDQYSTMKEKITNLENTIKQQNKTIKQLQLKLEQKTNNANILTDEYNKLQHKRQQSHIKNQKIANALQIDLANAQKHILDMTSIVEIKQKLPTVNETVIKYENLRDQSYADTNSILKEYFKQNNDYKKNIKYYKQTLHQIMFESLKLCYISAAKYKDKMFQNIANELNIKYVFKQTKIDQDELDDAKNDNNEQEIYKKLVTIFSPFFKNHYKYILKEDGIITNVLNTMIKKCSEYDFNFNKKEIYSLRNYIVNCTEICWVMVLQEPPLSIGPTEWDLSSLSITYNDSIHKRALGSDKNCQNVLYVVWPSIKRNNIYLQNMKIQVILGNTVHERL